MSWDDSTSPRPQKDAPPTEVPRPSVRRTVGVIIGGAALVLILFLAGLWFSKKVQQQAFIVPRLAPLPDLGDRHPELRQRLTEANRKAQGYFGTVDALAQLATLYQANGFSSEAETTYETLLALAPSDPRWFHQLASHRANYGDIDLAIPLWQDVIKLAPDYLPAHLRLAEALLKTGSTDQAASRYRYVLSKEPKNAYAHLGLARCELAGQTDTGGREHLEQAVTLEPALTQAWSLLASLYERQKEPTLAQVARQRAKGQNREAADPWTKVPWEDQYDPYQLGVAAAMADLSGEKQEARKGYTRAVVLAPNDALSRRLLGKFLAERDELPLARKELEKAVELDPQNADGWLFLFQVSTAQGDIQRAYQVLQDGLTHCPTSPGLHQENGRRLAAAGNTAAAIASFQEAKRLRPQEAAAYIDLAVLYLRTGRAEDGVAEFRAAHNAEPGHPMPVMALARHAIDTKDESGARHWIRQLRLLGGGQPAEIDALTELYKSQFGRLPW